MFDLDHELGKWRQRMAEEGLSHADLVNELEEHLREDFEHKVRSGTPEPDAFHLALEGLGRPSALKKQFDLIDRTSVGRILRRHKWKVVLCSLAGLFAALGLHLLRPAPYLSDAKLLMRFRLADTGKIPPGQNVRSVPVDEGLTAKVLAERDMLTSTDLARQVAEGIGAKKLLRKAGGGEDLGRATALVKNGLTVQVHPGSTVLHIAFRHPDSEILQPALREVIKRYLTMHVERGRARGDEGPMVGKISNISSIKTPSPPVFDSGASYRMMATLVGAGVLLGLVWALLAGRYFDHGQRRQPRMG